MKIHRNNWKLHFFSFENSKVELAAITDSFFFWFVLFFLKTFDDFFEQLGPVVAGGEGAADAVRPADEGVEEAVAGRRDAGGGAGLGEFGRRRRQQQHGRRRRRRGALLPGAVAGFHEHFKHNAVRNRNEELKIFFCQTKNIKNRTKLVHFENKLKLSLIVFW